MFLSSFFSRSHFEKMLAALTKRFPLPALIVFGLTGCLFYMIFTETESLLMIRVVFSLIVTFFLSIGFTLYSEAYNKKNYLSWIYQGISILYGILFYFFFNPGEHWIYESVVLFVLHGVGFFSFLFFAPYSREMVGKGENMIEYTNYFTRVAWTFLMASIIGIALLALGMIALTATIELFDLSQHIDTGKWYGYWAVLSLAFFAPLYGLVEFPHHELIEKKTYDVNRFFSFLIRYIALPFIIIYFIILYAYSVRVLMNFQDWPKGQISWMVIGFSIFGYLVHIFSKPYEGENTSIRLWRKYFPMLVVPQIFMLAYAIWLRIAQYDLTMNRYFVVIFGVWLFGISLYYIFSRRKSLIVIPASLTLVTLLISVGPWSVYSVPVARQYTRLMANFEKAGMVESGNIIPAPKDLDSNLQNDIYSGIEYVCKFSECKKIRALFPDIVAKAEKEGEASWKKYNTTKKYPGISQWEIISAVTQHLGIFYSYNPYVGEQKYFTYSIRYTKDDGIFPIDTSGYSTLMRMNIDTVPGERIGNFSEQYVGVDTENATVTVYSPSGNEGPFSLAPFNEKIIRNFGTGSVNNVNEMDLTYEFDTPTMYIKLIFENYSIKNPLSTNSGTEYAYPSAYGYALIRKK